MLHKHLRLVILVLLRMGSRVVNLIVFFTFPVVIVGCDSFLQVVLWMMVTVRRGIRSLLETHFVVDGQTCLLLSFVGHTVDSLVFSSTSHFTAVLIAVFTLLRTHHALPIPNMHLSRVLLSFLLGNVMVNLMIRTMKTFLNVTTLALQTLALRGLNKEFVGRIAPRLSRVRLCYCIGLIISGRPL
jgi:hypothetical protein